MKSIGVLVVGGAIAVSGILGISGFGLLLNGSGAAYAAQVAAGTTISPGLALPAMNPVEGKKLFASKGCVVYHAVNGVGGTDAPALDASTMKPVMSPFDFFAKMWNHSQGMLAMQENELGGQIKFTGQEIADMIAFVHDAAVQKSFTEDDIPEAIKKHMEEGDEGSGKKNMGTMMNGQGTMNGQGMMNNQQQQ